MTTPTPPDQPLIPGLKPGASPVIQPAPPAADADLPVVYADREPWNANWIRVLARRRAAAEAAGLDPNDPENLTPTDDEDELFEANDGVLDDDEE